MSNRDKQFQGFAKLLWEEIMEMTLKGYGKIDVGTDPTAYELLIARAAHSLVEHTVGYSLEYLHECGHELSGGMGSRITPSIPDMTKLPDEWVMGKIEAFKKLSSPGVTFSDEQKKAIQERQNLSGSQFDQEYLGKFVE